jgi:hypothetical protein
MVGIRYLKKTLLSQSSAHCGLYLINHLVTWRFHAKGHFIEKFGQEGNFRMGSETGTMTYTRGSVLDTKVMDPFKWMNGLGTVDERMELSTVKDTFHTAQLIVCRT